jgi:site-specific recombinase XerD
MMSTGPRSTRRRAGFSPPKITALLKTCDGTSFEDRRDTAIFRAFMDNGVRVSGLAGLRYDPDKNDVFLGEKRLRIRLKGGDEIWVPVGKKARAALDRYVRARARHPAADSEWFVLGVKGRGVRHMTSSGIYRMVRRGAQAGIPDAHPHRFAARSRTTTSTAAEPLTA